MRFGARFGKTLSILLLVAGAFFALVAVMFFFSLGSYSGFERALGLVAILACGFIAFILLALGLGTHVVPARLERVGVGEPYARTWAVVLAILFAIGILVSQTLLPVLAFILVAAVLLSLIALPFAGAWHAVAAIRRRVAEKRARRRAYLAEARKQAREAKAGRKKDGSSQI